MCGGNGVEVSYVKGKEWERIGGTEEIAGEGAFVCSSVLGDLQIGEGQDWSRSRGLARARASRFWRKYFIDDHILVLGTRTYQLLE